MAKKRNKQNKQNTLYTEATGKEAETSPRTPAYRLFTP